VSVNNSVLLNNLGNFVNRILKFVCGKHYHGMIPSSSEEHDQLPAFATLKEETNTLLAQYIQELDAVKLRAGITTALQISQLGNSFLQASNLTNRLAEEEPKKCAAVAVYSVNLIHLLASLIEPYMPDTAASINRQLNTTLLPIPDQWAADSIKPGHVIGTPEYLFRRIAPEKAEEWRGLYGNQKKAKNEEAGNQKKAKNKDGNQKKAKNKEDGNQKKAKNRDGNQKKAKNEEDG
jgi:methionyl-tRNA synthetase